MDNARSTVATSALGLLHSRCIFVPLHFPLVHSPLVHIPHVLFTAACIFSAPTVLAYYVSSVCRRR